MVTALKLTVKKSESSDVYGDVVRIHKDARGKVSEGSICRIEVGSGKSVLRAVRGLGTSDENNNIIKMDLVTRTELGITLDEKHEFKLSVVWWPRQIWWAWNASDPTPRLAARLGVLSVGLGVLSALLGVWSFIK